MSPDSSTGFYSSRMSRRPGQTPPAVASPASAGAASWPAGWVCALIFLVAVVAYWPALLGGFLWDDAGHVTRADLRSWTGLGRIWCEFGATQQYYPMLHSAFWFEHRLWGDSTVCYHLLNVLLHASAACLFGLLLCRLAVPGARLAALLFALHPVCVESVAWISEQKNTLSLVFYLCAALAYLRFDQDRRGARYGLATGIFLLALLTKTVTASLPAALLVVFWWQRGRLEWRRDVRPLLPWWALGVASGLVTAHFERALIGAQGADFDLSVVQRCLLAGRVFWFYLGKLAWPADLVFIYPHWTVDASVWWQWLFLAGALALLGGLVWWQRRQRAPLAAALLFGGTLFPVLGFVNVFPFLFSYVADHFQYLASLAVFALVAAGLTQAALRLPRWGRCAGSAALLTVLGALTWAQSGTYCDVVTLYETTLARNPACWMAHNNLALELAGTGRTTEAIPHLEQALRLRPDFAEGENNLGDDLRQLGRPQDAIPHLQHALKLQPTYAEAHGNLGVALLLTGHPAEGIAELTEALRLKPDYAMARYNLGMARADTGHPDEAIRDFAEAVRLNPNFGEAELNWGIGLAIVGRFPEAISHFDRAMELEPESPAAHCNYGRALAVAGRLDDAIRQYEKAVTLDPGSADAHLGLALALHRVGREAEAEAHYREAMRLRPATR
jgi:tetratricopeptide (TPR) repeat protein